MNILFDIGHPGHVHLFRNVSEILEADGHNVFFSVRNIPSAMHLMDVYGMKYYSLGNKGKTLLQKALSVLRQDVLLWRFVKKHKIDIGICSGIALPHVSKLTKMKSFVFDDDDDAAEPLVVKFAHPFTSLTFSPDSISRICKNVQYYSGTHELAYLHPNRFSPDPSVLDRHGISISEKYFIVRFVAFMGHHDVGQGGLSYLQKKELIELLTKYGRVFITSEKPIEAGFEKYRLPVPPEDIHSFMYYSSMFLGDSQTMTSEACILGVPALKCNTFAGKLSVPNELERKYGLCFAYQPSEFNEFLSRVKYLLESDGLKLQWKMKREKFLSDKIDVTAFFVWFIENYPESRRIMKENPDYQYRFR